MSITSIINVIMVRRRLAILTTELILKLKEIAVLLAATSVKTTTDEGDVSSELPEVGTGEVVVEVAVDGLEGDGDGGQTGVVGVFDVDAAVTGGADAIVES